MVDGWGLAFGAGPSSDLTRDAQGIFKMTPLQKVAGIGRTLATALANRGIATAEQLAAASPDILLDIPRLGALRAEKLLTAARSAVSGDTEQGLASQDPAEVEASDPPVMKDVGKNKKTPQKESGKPDKKASDKKSKARESKATKSDAKKAEIKKPKKKKSEDDKSKKKAEAKATKAPSSKKAKSTGTKKEAKLSKVKTSKATKKK